MFDKYTEAARRVIFYARYEASQAGSHYIEPYHLLLVLLREDWPLRTRVLGKTTLDDVRAEFAHLAGSSKIPTSVDLPLSREAKRALAFAAEEAKIAGSPVIGPEHLLASLLQVPTSASEALTNRGITLQFLRESFGAPRVEAELRIQALLGAMLSERLPAAILILEALASPAVTVTVTTPTSQFTASFPPDPRD
jgi:ATP-dependent Clp protease ATP-binding subunit ClpC